MKRLNVSVFFLTCLLLLLFEDSAPEQNFRRGTEHSHGNFVKHPRVFLDVSPIAIQRVLDALYCAFECIGNERCFSFNIKVKPGEDQKRECRLLDTDKFSAAHLLNSSKEFDHYGVRSRCESSPCQNGGTCRPVYGNPQQYKCDCTAGFTGAHCEQSGGKSCEDIAARVPTAADGVHEVKLVDGQTFKAFCDMTTDNKGWTLMARFSNNDAKNWMKNSGEYWYDRTSAVGQTTDPANNTDMISPAFWLVNGTEFKITRSDDPSHTALLHTTGGCLGGQTFRFKMTSYGDFRGGKVWASNACLGRCDVQYGGQYKNTEGFDGAECDGWILRGSQIGFWCDSYSRGAVMTIGGCGGGTRCVRADHGIGITEADEASLVHDGHGDVVDQENEYDYGKGAWNVNPALLPTYALNMWVR